MSQGCSWAEVIAALAITVSTVNGNIWIKWGFLWDRNDGLF
jgi:hypothetical protein